MRQLTAQNLIEILETNTEKPLLLQNAQITGFLKKTKISQIHFENCQFFNFNSNVCLFSECKFSDVKITHANFHHTEFTNCIIEDLTIFNTNFTYSQISTSKLSNVVSSKMVFENSNIQYTKFICNSLIATKFYQCKMLDAFFEYNTLDASTFEKTIIQNSIFRSSNMRGTQIMDCKIENTIMDYINFDDSLNINASEFFIPTKFTIIKNNKTTNFTISNTILKKSFKDFTKSNFVSKAKTPDFSLNKVTKTPSFSFPKIRLFKFKKTEKPKEKTEVSEKPKKHIFPHHLSGRNIGSVTTFVLQGLLTLTIILLFSNFYKTIQNVFYKNIPNLIEFPINFVHSSIEIHKFAFYFSLMYFTFSGILMCINVVCIRGIHNLLLVWLYRLQSFITLFVLGWLWWNNIILQSLTISLLNLVFAFYFFIMIIQSFGTTNRGEHEQGA